MKSHTARILKLRTLYGAQLDHRDSQCNLASAESHFQLSFTLLHFIHIFYTLWCTIFQHQSRHIYLLHNKQLQSLAAHAEIKQTFLSKNVWFIQHSRSHSKPMVNVNQLSCLHNFENKRSTITNLRLRTTHF